MPSSPHEILIELFRRSPKLAVDLLRSQFGIEVPAFTRTQAVDTALRDLLPVENKADLLLLFENDAPVFAVILEVQFKVDREKARRWPTYVAAVHDRHRCPTALVVVTTSRRVAKWARGPFHAGPGSSLSPVVIDGSHVRRLDEIPASERTASEALLSVGVHVRSLADRALESLALDPGLPGLDLFDDPRDYVKLVIAVLPKHLRAALEEQMAIDLSDIVPWTDQYELRGEARGEVRGEVRGLERGRLLAGRQTFRRLASRRGWTLLPAHDARLDACTNPDQLDVWLDRLITAATVDEALD